MHISYQIKSPLDGLIVQLSTETFGLRQDEIKKKEREIDGKSFLIRQLGLLRTVYINLVESGLRVIDKIKQQEQGATQISISEVALESPRDSNEVVLDYYSFINILCQLSRVLPHYFPGAATIPKYSRIRFYRNKVVEHWDAYTKNIGPTGFTFTKDKASIPFIEAVFEYKERQLLLTEVKNTFTKLGVKFDWNKEAHNILGNNPGYCEAIFTAVEKTGKISYKAGIDNHFDDLVKLLLKLGFPGPIVDVEEYCRELIDFLKQLIKKYEVSDPPTSNRPLGK